MDWKSRRVRAILEGALVEDKAASDVTTALTIDPRLRASGTIVAKARIQPIIVTLAVMIAARGLAQLISGDAVRNFCAGCGGLVFGGEVGQDDQHTVYAGSLDAPARFQPTIAIFLRDKPEWVRLPEGITPFETMPE